MQKLRRMCDREPEEREVVISGQDRKLNSAKDVEDTVRAIGEEEGLLTTLILSGNSMGVQAAQAIAGALASRPTLRRALWKDMFVGRLRSEIPPALTSLSDAVMAARAQLVELDLSDNAFGPTGIEAIFQLLSGPACFSLKILKLNNTGMGPQGGEMLAEALGQCSSEASRTGCKLQLEVFVVGRSRLENTGASALAEVFSELGSLVEVSMPQNGISKEGISALASAFAKNTGLRSIDLNDNTFTEEGAVAMATVLPSLQELRVVNFGDCLLKSEGARAVAEAIADGHQKLEEVYFGYNSMDTSSAVAVVEALANKKELKKIDFNGNCFGEEGCETVRECLEAKGLAECLESLSDDEGEENEEEEEDEEEEEEGEEGKEEDEEGEKEEEEGGEKRSEAEQEEKDPVEKVTVEDYLNNPSSQNLLALGGARVELVTSTLGECWGGEEAGRMYVKVASCYSDSLSPELKSAVEQTIDAVVGPVCVAGKTSPLLNEILVQVGLLKSEDKSFVPVKNIDGPVLALTHIITQNYFPKHCRDTLISFIQKPHQGLTAMRPKVLQVLYAP